MPQRSLFLLHLVALLTLGTLAGAQDWPHWRGPNDTGIATSKNGINTDWAAKPPPVLWTVPMYDSGFSGPAVVGGKVYILDHKGANDMIRCLDLATGVQLWKTPFAEKDGETRSTVAVADGKAYAFTRSGRAACVDALDGHLVWTRQLRDDFKGSPPAAFGFGSSPFVDGKQVIYCPGNKTGATVVALNKDTGETIWQSGSEEPGYGTPFAATLGGVRQYIVFTGSAIISLEPETGVQLWRYEWREQENCNGNAPTVVGDTLVFNSGYDHGFGYIDVSKGTSATKIWENRGQGRAWGSKVSSPIVYKGCIYLSSENLNFGCLDLKTGKELWAHWNDGDTGICMVDDVIFTLKSPDSTLVMIKPSPDGYNELGRATVLPKGSATVAPAFADGKLLVRNHQYIACVDLSKDAQAVTPPTTTATTPPTTTNPPAVPMPDLIITKLTLDPPAPKAGEVVTFGAIVKNQGTGDTQDGTIIGVRFLVDTPTPVIWSDNETSALAPGKSVAVLATGGTAGGTWTATTGTHTLTAIVDDANRFIESNKDNNTLKLTFTIP